MLQDQDSRELRVEEFNQEPETACPAEAQTEKQSAEQTTETAAQNTVSAANPANPAPETNAGDHMQSQTGWQFSDAAQKEATEQQAAPAADSQAPSFAAGQPVYTVGGPTYEAQWGLPQENKKKKEKKVKKPMTGGRIVGLCVSLCLIFSLLFGVGGAYLIHSLTGGSNAIVIQQTSTPVTETGSTTNSINISAVATATAPSVVEITTEQVTTGSFMQQYIQKGAGSGVIISADGYIVTNNHVISGATTITVRTSDAKTYTAKLIGTDSQTDIAVLKVEATGLTPATLGDSSKIVVGDPCVVIGNPLGALGGTVTDGIISALDREVTIDNVAMRLLQTNAAVNPGNSGGGMFDQYGSLIAIVNAKSSGNGIEGLGFAIPINVAKPIIEDLMQYGYVKGRPYMGIVPVDITDAQTARYYGVSEYGVYILKITSDSPASKAGLKSGDRVVSIDGKEVSSSANITSYLSSCKVGQTVKVVVNRAFGNETVSVTLAESKATNS